MSNLPLNRPVRTAILGYGFAGRAFHSYLVGLVPGLQLVGIASRNPETRQWIESERHCHAYTSAEEVFADPEIDLVVVATPNGSHADLAISALQAGKHVVTDKIMCLTLADCDRMLAAATQANRLLTVFQNRRFDGDFLTAKHAMETGLLGDVRWIEMAWQGFGAWGGWRGKAAMGGGRFYDLGAHLVDQLLQFFPEPVKSVYCRMHHDYPDTDVESEALLIVTFAGGRTGVCDLSGMTHVSKPRFLLRGSRATFSRHGLDPQERAMIAGDIDSATWDPADDAVIQSREGEKRLATIPGRWRNYYENIAAVLTEGAEPVVQPHEMRRVMTVIDAAVRSSATGQAVTLG